MATGSWACTLAPATHSASIRVRLGAARTIVGIGLEGQAPQCNHLALQLPLVVGADALEQHALLRGVALLDSLQHHGAQAHAVRRVDQRLHIFGKAAAAVASARVNEVVADARVAANALAHRFNVGAQLFRPGWPSRS